VHYKLFFKTNEVLLLFPVRQQLVQLQLQGQQQQLLHLLPQQVMVVLLLRNMMRHLVPLVELEH
jgi:hypothetical protein